MGDDLPTRGAYDEWYWAALGCSVVSGAALVAICALLALNHARREPYNPLEAKEYRDLKEALALSPTDDGLKGQIRDLDLKLRKEHFDRLAFSWNGAYVLLGAVLLFVLCMKWVFACRRPLPVPKPDADEEVGPPSWRLALGSTATVGFLLLGGAVILGTRPTAGPARGRDGQQGEEGPVGAPAAEVATWPLFRGHGGLGISPWADAPSAFDVAKGDGILWKVEVPLPGQGSPILWGKRLFLSGATEIRREVYAFDADAGTLLWKAVVPPDARAPAEPPEVLEATGFAASTPATDGLRVAAIFATGDLGCFDLEGKPLWAKHFGPLENHYGHASSLLVHGDRLMVLLDEGSEEDGKSRLLALRMATGEPVWEAKRPVGNSWTTPIVIATPRGEQLITSANPFVISYEPSTGKELWRADCMGGDVAPSPIYAKDLVFAVNLDAELVAIRPDGVGDVTETHIAWRGEDGLPDIVSPLSDGELLFVVTTSGKVTCYDVASGEVVWAEKLKLPCNSSPSLVGKLVHLWTQKGVLLVFEAAREYKEVGRSELGEEVNASAAFAPGRVYVRGARSLYCLGKR